MATPIYSLILKDERLQGAFNRLVRLGRDLRPVWQDFGETLIQPHQNAWEAGRSPEGDAWAPLSPATLKRKKTERMLYEEGDMLRGLVVAPSATELSWGLEDEKSPWHHFGTRRMPARPLVGMPPEGQRNLADLLEDHIDEAWR